MQQQQVAHVSTSAALTPWTEGMCFLQESTHISSASSCQEWRLPFRLHPTGLPT